METTFNTLPVEFLVECYSSNDAKKQAFYKEATKENENLRVKIHNIWESQKAIKKLNKELYSLKKKEATNKVKALAKIVTNSKCASTCDHVNAIWTSSENKTGYIRLIEDGFCPTCLNRITKVKKAF